MAKADGLRVETLPGFLAVLPGPCGSTSERAAHGSLD